MQFIEYLFQQLFPSPTFKNSIRPNRIKKEQELCQNVEWESIQNIDIIKFHSQQCIGYIKLNQLYPFSQPHLKFDIDEQYHSLFNLEDYNQYDYYFKSLKWTPQITVNQIVDKSQDYLNKYIHIKQPYEFDPYSDFMSKIQSNYIIFIILALINLLLYLPNYIEYQQYMEKCTTFSYNRWYTPFQSIPLSPLKAQFYYFIGLIVAVYDQSKLHNQVDHTFYHYLNIIINFIFYYIPLYLLLKSKLYKLNKFIVLGILLYQMTCPTLIGIWNISETLILLTIYMMAENFWFGSMIYVIAYNYEPQLLLLSPIMIIYTFGRLCQLHDVISKRNLKPNFQNLKGVFFEGTILILVLILIQCFILIPFLLSQALNVYVYPFNKINLEFNILIRLGLSYILLLPSLILSFLSEKYQSLSILTCCIILKLFQFEISIQMITSLLMINFNYFRLIINNIIILQPQYNISYKLIYYIFGNLFIERNNQLLNKDNLNQFQYLKKVLFYFILIISFIKQIENYVFYLNLIIILIQCLYTIKQKIEKVIKKTKVD